MILCAFFVTLIFSSWGYLLINKCISKQTHIARGYKRDDTEFNSFAADDKQTTNPQMFQGCMMSFI